MQEENTLNANLILNRLKKALKINRDIQLSEFLNVRPNTISTWKKRNTLDYNAIISICELYEIDLNEIFLEKKSTRRDDFTSLQTPLISREVQFQYCLGDTSTLETLPMYSFPFIKGDKSRAFQVTSNNMFPLIEENSLAICEGINIKDVQNKSIVVIISKSKGIFINRISRTTAEKKTTFLLSSENSFFNNITITSEDISEIWLIKGILSYNMNSADKFKLINDSLNKINKTISKKI